MLEALAPEDAEVALEELRLERERRRRQDEGRLRVWAGYWIQLLSVGGYGLRDGVVKWFGGARGPRLRPGTALRLAARGLVRRPGTAVTAVLTLGVGLGAAVGLLGVTYGTFRTLPVPEGERIVRVELRDAKARSVSPSASLLGPSGWTGEAVEELSAFQVVEADLRDREGFAVRRSAARMPPEVFELLRVTPATGRIYAAGEDRVTVIGYDLWQELLSGASDVVGSTVRVDGAPHTVVGVMPEGFAFPFNQSLWLPLIPPRDPGAVLAGAELVGRLAPDATTEQAARTLEATLSGLPDAGDERAPRRVTVRPFGSGRGEAAEGAVLAGLGVLVVILLTIAAANVSTLLLVRAVERADTLAVHAALGAGRSQIALQLFAESVLVASGGGALGLLLGYGLLSWIEANLSVHWGYYWMRMELRPSVAAWALLLVLGSAVASGTAPALRAMRTDLGHALKAGRSGPSRGLGRWFAGVQVALSTVALVATVSLGLGVLRSLGTVGQLPLDEVTVARVSPDTAMAADADARRALAAELMEALAARFPGGAAALSTGMPTFGGSPVAVDVPGASDGPPDAPTQAVWIAATPAYFGMYDLSRTRGRLFTEADVAGAPSVALINESFVRRFLQGFDPVGLPLGVEGVPGLSGPVTVVGVVADGLPDHPGSRSDRLYLPLAQVDARSLLVSVRSGDVSTVSAGVREAVRGIHEGLPVQDVRSLRDLVAWLNRLPRTLGVLGALGGLAGVLVASIGLYGLLAFQVRTRFPEFGVRMALGAPSRRIVLEVLGEGVRRMAPGLAVGMGLAALLSPILASFVFGFGPSLLLVYGGVLATMLVVGLVASLAPAVRAARLDPLSVLRSE